MRSSIASRQIYMSIKARLSRIKSNNSTDHLPALQSNLVLEVLKENYDVGFATVEWAECVRLLQKGLRETKRLMYKNE